MSDAPTDLLAVSERILSGTATIDERHPVSITGGTTLNELGDGLAFLESFANVTAVVADDELLLIDAGGILHAGAVHEQVRAWTDAPLRTAVYTHGHVDHVFAVPLFEAEGREPSPHVIAHENVPRRFDRYLLTNGYNGVINQRQFQLPVPMFPSDFRYPDEVYRSDLTISIGGFRVELHHDKGETDDGTWAWIPEQKVLCTGDLFIWAAPNCGNPQKVQRFPWEWAVALRKMSDLGAELLLPGHGLPIAGADRIRTVLSDTAELLESIHAQTLDLMNAGATLDELVHTVAVPEHLRGQPWLQPVYDEPEFVVRNLWRLYGGWYDGNPAHLKPAREAEVATEVAELAGGASVLAARERLSSEGDHRLVCHLAEYAALAAPDDPGVHRIRAAVYAARGRQERSLMARGVYRWAELQSDEAARSDGAARPDGAVRPDGAARPDGTVAVIVGRGAYRSGVRMLDDPDADGTQDLTELAQACTVGNDFVWVGLLDPSEHELQHAAAAFGIHPLALEDAQLTHERPKVDVFGDTLTIVLRTRGYIDETETVEFGQITMMASPNHIVVVRHGNAVPLDDLRSRMEADPEWLDQGPGAVMHAIIDEIVEAYTPVLAGIADDIDEVEEVVFSASRENPTQRIYELKREVLEFGKAANPLAVVLDRLKVLEHPVLNDELRRYFADTDDDVVRVVEQIVTDRELLTGALEANLTQVSVRQNEDMRKISAWVAIAAVPTMIAGIYGMNFDHMPELGTRYGYYVVLVAIALACFALYRTFKRSGWL